MLFVFVEGSEDEKFFKEVLSSCLGECKYILYASLTDEKIKNFIKSIDSASGWRYIFTADADGKKIKDAKKYWISKGINLSCDKIHIIQYEVESWYYAGVSQDICKKLKLTSFEFNTDTLTKEQFIAKITQNHRLSREATVRSDMLQNYSLDLATQRNTSLKLFMEAITKEPA